MPTSFRNLPRVDNYVAGDHHHHRLNHDCDLNLSFHNSFHISFHVNIYFIDVDVVCKLGASVHLFATTQFLCGSHGQCMCSSTPEGGTVCYNFNGAYLQREHAMQCVNRLPSREGVRLPRSSLLSISHRRVCVPATDAFCTTPPPVSATCSTGSGKCGSLSQCYCGQSVEGALVCFNKGVCQSDTQCTASKDCPTGFSCVNNSGCIDYDAPACIPTSDSFCS